MLYSILLGLAVVGADFLGRMLLKLPASPILTALLFVIVVVEASILTKTGKIPGAVVFGFVATLLSLLLSVVGVALLDIAITMIYWSTLGYAVAFVTPRAGKVVGVTA